MEDIRLGIPITILENLILQRATAIAEEVAIDQVVVEEVVVEVDVIIVANKVIFHVSVRMEAVVEGEVAVEETDEVEVVVAVEEVVVEEVVILVIIAEKPVTFRGNALTEAAVGDATEVQVREDIATAGEVVVAAVAAVGEGAVRAIIADNPDIFRENAHKVLAEEKAAEEVAIIRRFFSFVL